MFRKSVLGCRAAVLLAPAAMAMAAVLANRLERAAAFATGFFEKENKGKAF